VEEDAMDASEVVRSLYPSFIDRDVGAVLGSFAPRATVDTPLGGRQQPTEWLASEGAWLLAHKAHAEELNTVAAEDRVAHELTLWVTIDDEEQEVPVMLVADVEGGKVRDLRVYHSTYPISGSHVVRSPIIDPDPSLEPAEPIGAYHRGLAAGDADAIDELFEADGYVREPAGSAYAHSGDERREWYRSVSSAGPLELHLCTVTDDGTTLVFEYTADSWGRFSIPAQCGAAAYERAPSGKLAAARIYDDFEPPPELFE
jgi:hypothetical protein